MRRAVWNGAVLAQSDATVVVEGNHCFPADAVAVDHLRPSSRRTVCPWKGVASYYDVVVGDRVNRDAAWYYSNPIPAARMIKGYVAFWHGVRVEKVAIDPQDGGPPPRRRRSWLRRALGG